MGHTRNVVGPHGPRGFKSLSHRQLAFYCVSSRSGLVSGVPFYGEEITTMNPGFRTFLYGSIIHVIFTLVLYFILDYLLKITHPWKSILLVVLGNLAIYWLTTGLYFWKAQKLEPEKDNELIRYLSKSFSLRPLAGFAEIILFTFFFLFRPEIVAGYLVVKGISGYRGEPYNKLNKAEVTGEYSSISKIGTVLALLISVWAAAILKQDLSEITRQYLEFLIPTH